jgi:hypothetical protein
MSKHFIFFIALCYAGPFIHAQNIGVGTTNPTQKLDVNGTTKTNGVIINNGGSQYDFLMKTTPAGDVGFRKGFGATCLNYIICVSGAFPPFQGNPPQVNPVIGEIKVFAGAFPPAGWAFCDGALINIAQNTALFAIISTTYGGNGQTNFALPDLRGTVIVCSGMSTSGNEWLNGEEHF